MSPVTPQLTGSELSFAELLRIHRLDVLPYSKEDRARITVRRKFILQDSLHNLWTPTNGIHTISSATELTDTITAKYSDLHIGSPEHSPCLLRRVFHQSSLLCHLLILSSIALECNKFCGKLSNDVLTFIVLFIFEFCDVSVAFLLFFDLVVLPKISTYG